MSWFGAEVQKSIAIFTYKQWILSIGIKTKVVQHVPRIGNDRTVDGRVWPEPYPRITHVTHVTHVNYCNHVVLTGSQLLSDFQGTSSINSNVTRTGAVVKISSWARGPLFHWQLVNLSWQLASKLTCKNLQHATCNFRFAICNLQLATCKFAICNLQVCNLQLATCN